MNYTLHQLQIFEAVARKKSITKAAESLHMTQPAVSIQIKQLQNSVGTPLIKYSGKTLFLTEAGDELLRVQQTIKTQTDAFEAYVSELKGGLKGTLSVSAASTAKYFLPYLLGAFQKKYPGVKISLKVTNRDEVLSHLYENEYQLAILTQLPADNTIAAEPFLSNPLVMACPPDHPLAKKKNLSLEDLKNEPFIYRESGSGTRMVMERELEAAGIFPEKTMELATNEAVKQAIMAGIGISLISDLSMKSELQTGMISTIDLLGYPIQTHWHVLYKRDKIISRVFLNFIDFLKDEKNISYLPGNIG